MDLNLKRILGIPTLEDLRLVRRVEGVAVFPYPVKLGEGDKGPEIQFEWQLGPRAPGPKDMLLIWERNHGRGKGWEPVGWIPKDVVTACDIRMGDVVSGIAMSKTTVLLDPDAGEIELPLIEPMFALASASEMTRTFVPQNLRLLINGEPPAERVDWRFGVDPRDVYYPQTAWELGTEDPAVQMVQLVGPLGRGAKMLIQGRAGSSKTTIGFRILEAMARNNTGRPIYFVIGIFGERPEDVGHAKREFERVVYRPDGTLVDGVVGVQNFFMDADYEASPMQLLLVAQACVGFAQRQIERCGRLPVEQRYSVVVFIDSMSRLFTAMDLMGEGKGKTLSGGRDPWSNIMGNLLAQTGRSAMIPDPSGQEDWVDVTVIATLLGDSTQLSLARMESQEATVVYFLPLLGPEQRPPGSRVPLTPCWNEVVVRRPELLVPQWQIEARHRLRAQLYQPGRRGVPDLRDDAVLIAEGLLAKHGSALVVLKSLVPDLLLSEEVSRAKELLAAGVVPPDLSGLEVLVEALQVPKDWGSRIWDKLSDEGLLPSLEKLREEAFNAWALEHLQKLRELISQGRVFRSADEVASVLKVTVEQAEELLGHLQVEDWVKMALVAWPEINELLANKQGGRADILQHFFGIPFGTAKKVNEKVMEAQAASGHEAQARAQAQAPTKRQK